MTPLKVSAQFPLQLQTKGAQALELAEKNQEELAGILEQLQNLEKKIKGIQADIKDELRSAIGSLEVSQSNKISIVEKQLSDIQSEILALQTEINNELDTTRTFHNAFQDEIKKQLSDQEREIASQFSEISSILQRKDDEISAITSTIEKNAKSRQAELTTLESTISTTINDSLVEESKKNQSLITTLSQELDEQSSEIDNLKSSLSAIEETLHIKDTELTKLRTFMTEKGADIENLESVIIKSLEDANNETFALLSTISKDLDKKEQDIAFLRKAIDNLNQRINILTSKGQPEGTAQDVVSQQKTKKTSEKKVDDLTGRLGQQKPAVKGTTTAPVVNDVKEEQSNSESLYSEAIATLKDKDFPQALKKFQHFLSLYPQSSLSDNAQYWIGEIYFALQSYDKAVREFERVIKEFPESNKVPDSIYMKGQALQKLGNKAEARSLFNEVINDYPSHQVALKAKEKLKEVSE